MTSVSLRERIYKLAILALVIVTTAAIGLLLGYSKLEQAIARRTIAESLSKSALRQSEELVPSLVLTEQRAGIDLLLRHFHDEEALSDIRVIQKEQKSQSPFLAARSEGNGAFALAKILLKQRLSFPSGRWEKLLVTFFKSKKNETSIASEQVFRLLGLIVILMAMTFLALFSVTARLLSVEIPNALEELVQWIEDVLNEKARSGAPNLKFKELNELARKITEVTERHEKERDQAIIGQLTSGIMHDIKTPLHSMVTAVSLVEEQEPGTPKRLSRLENLFKVCSSKLPLIGGIIESTLDGNRAVHVDLRFADLNETIRSALLQSSDLPNLKYTDLEFQGSTEPLWVPHDPVQISRVLANLVKNGLEASSTKKSDSAESSPRVKVSLQKASNSSARIRVEDNGPGLQIPPDRIFRVFRSGKPRGNGLGLLVSKKIIEAHHGSIHATRSDALCGAMFEIDLPLAKEVSA